MNNPITGEPLDVEQEEYDNFNTKVSGMVRAAVIVVMGEIETRTGLKVQILTIDDQAKTKQGTFPIELRVAPNALPQGRLRGPFKTTTAQGVWVDGQKIRFSFNISSLINLINE